MISLMSILSFLMRRKKSGILKNLSFESKFCPTSPPIDKDIPLSKMLLLRPILFLPKKHLEDHYNKGFQDQIKELHVKLTKVQASQNLILGEVGSLKKSFDANFATSTGLLVDIKTDVSIKVDSRDLDLQNQMDFDHVSQDYFDDVCVGEYQDIKLSENLGADLEHSVKIASDFVTHVKSQSKNALLVCSTPSTPTFHVSNEMSKVINKSVERPLKKSSYIDDKSNRLIVVYDSSRVVDGGAILPKKREVKLSVVIKSHFMTKFGTSENEGKQKKKEDCIG
ncbi:uncharacterized protein LOC133794223 [Humulus lupulus]|uniref:uncharacterized protein LOC133794223 n=1 Tax=Humulus lupulus TaxID=3486 RepID=UPI002B4009D0|nr:uncharacterized protein LOC133794223 [Humulus lupulus]